MTPWQLEREADRILLKVHWTKQQEHRERKLSNTRKKHIRTKQKRVKKIADQRKEEYKERSKELSRKGTKR